MALECMGSGMKECLRGDGREDVMRNYIQRGLQESERCRASGYRKGTCVRAAFRREGTVDT